MDELNAILNANIGSRIFFGREVLKKTERNVLVLFSLPSNDQTDRRDSKIALVMYDDAGAMVKVWGSITGYNHDESLNQALELM